ncbi:MAG: hypothetical protein IE886_04140 [Campylobacterales bacterium]|nr:hypothetical protein [Campylobacterales bacterium]
MSSHKNREHLEVIRDNIAASAELSDAEKSDGVKLVEEWIAEDKGFGLLYDALVGLSSKFDPLLKELGLD